MTVLEQGNPEIKSRKERKRDGGLLPFSTDDLRCSSLSCSLTTLNYIEGVTSAKRDSFFF